MHKYRLIILGAGFSRPAGLPLATDLWKEIRVTAGTFGSHHRANKFNEDLSDYITFQKDAVDEILTPDEIDFEDFMRFLDVEHYLGLRGSNTWSSDGNEGTVVSKYLIGKILARHVNSIKDVPDLYIQFADRLQPRDTVITFNYDTLLERALDSIRKPYRLFPARYEKVGEYSATVDDSQDEVVVLKMHGSIDWFDRADFDRRIELRDRMGSSPPSDAIFSNAAAFGLEPLVDGPRFEGDPLKSIYRARNLEDLYAKDFLFKATPRILAPSATKLLYANNLNNFWNGMGDAGWNNFGMAIIGFSLPAHDEYARQILYGLVTNYQRHNPDAAALGLKKSPLAVVDYFSDPMSENEFRKRYRFVDWSRAELVGGGFDPKSIDKVFA